MTRYHHLIWDWNGTLLNDVQTCVEVLNRLCRKYHKNPTTYDFYLQEFDFPVERFYKTLGFDFSQESYDQVARDYIALYTERQRQCSLHSHARSSLEHCTQLGLNQSILSAYHQSLLEEIVKDFNIHDYFDHIMGLSDLHAKSKVAVGHDLIKRLECPPQQVLLIGDTTHDHEVAQNLGVDCILIQNGHQHPDRLQACGIPVLTGLDQVPIWLQHSLPEPATETCNRHE